MTSNTICRNTYFNYGSYLRSRGYDKAICALVSDLKNGVLPIGPITPSGTCGMSVDGDVTIYACSSSTDGCLIASGGDPSGVPYDNFSIQASNGLSVVGSIYSNAYTGTINDNDTLYANSNTLYAENTYFMSNGGDSSHNIIVEGDISCNGTTYAQDISVNNNLYVLNDISCNGTTYAQDISVNNNLYVLNDASFNGTTYAQDISVNNNLYVLNDASFNGTTYAQDISVNNNLYVLNDISCNGTTYAQDISVNNLYVLNDASFNGTTYAQDISVNNNLYVLNDASFNGTTYAQDISVNNNLYVNGYTYIEDVSLNGTINMPSLSSELLSAGTHHYLLINSDGVVYRSAGFTSSATMASEFAGTANTDITAMNQRILDLEARINELETSS
jgi:hypothetical protein